MSCHRFGMDEVLAALASGDPAYVDTLEQAAAVLEAAAARWPEATQRYGWNCEADYDGVQKRWRFRLVCLSPLGVPE